MTIQTIATISNSFKTFLQNGNYESAILTLMNESSRVFPHSYEHNEKQSHGECDFFSYEGDEKQLVKYDTKLPFDKKEGALICSKKADFLKWIEFMMDEASEFSNCMIKNRGIHNVNEIQLYKTIDKRLRSIKDDENAIFFFPYPITHDGEGMLYTQMAADILSAIYDQLNTEGKVGTRRIYVIYPSIDQKIALRCLNNNVREYLPSAEISQHISYEFQISK